MQKYNRELVARQLAVLMNSAFQWTEKEQTAVVNINLLKPNILFLNINGEEFQITVNQATR